MSKADKSIHSVPQVPDHGIRTQRHDATEDFFCYRDSRPDYWVLRFSSEGLTQFSQNVKSAAGIRHISHCLLKRALLIRISSQDRRDYRLCIERDRVRAERVHPDLAHHSAGHEGHVRVGHQQGAGLPHDRVCHPCTAKLYGRNTLNRLQQWLDARLATVEQHRSVLDDHEAIAGLGQSIQ